VRRLEVLAVEGLPEVHPGDDLAQLIASHASLVDSEVVVVAQKVVSKPKDAFAAFGSDLERQRRSASRRS